MTNVLEVIPNIRSVHRNLPVVEMNLVRFQRTLRKRADKIFSECPLETN